MRHFNYFENGGPFPSACLSCGNNAKLFDLGREIQGGGMAQLCLTCVSELAEFIGYAEKQPLEAQIASLKSEIVSRETELAKVPTQVEDLINGIRSAVTDFIFAVSYSNDVDEPKVLPSVERPAVANSGNRNTPPRDAQTPRKPSSK